MRLARSWNTPAVAVAQRVAIGVLTALLVAEPACSHDTDAPDDLSHQEDVTLEDLDAALGCDAIRGASYDALRDREAPPPLPVIAEEGRDCYRDGRFLGRVHVFEEADASDVFSDQQVQGPASHQPRCQGESLQVITGDRWAVVTRGDATAQEVRDRLGGRELPMPPGSTTFVSYALPCVGEPEPD
jgi:hypothetical protein